MNSDDKSFIAGRAGYLAGAMAIPFVEWVVQNARYPVFMALRGAEPIAWIASALARLDPKKFGAAAEWKSVYITKPMAEIQTTLREAYAYSSYCDFCNISNSGPEQTIKYYGAEWMNICKYFLHVGLSRGYTLVDTGLSGKMAEDLGEISPNQTLLFVTSEHPHVKGFMNETRMDELCDMAKYMPHADGFAMGELCMALTSFIDAMPKMEKSPSRCRIADDGTAVPELEPEDASVIAMRDDYFAGLNMAVGKYKGGYLPTTRECLMELFKDGSIRNDISVLTGRHPCNCR